MEVIVLPFTRPPMTANGQRRAHWSQVRAAKRQVQDAVVWLARQQCIGRLGPSTVEVKWWAKDRRRRDADSLGPALKAVLDGLVEAGVFADDDSRTVVKTSMSIGFDPSNPRIEILIEELIDV